MHAPPAIRPLASDADYAACAALQRVTWGDDFRELVPPAILMISQKVGGIAAGAFDGDRMTGFVYGLTGVMDGEPVHWSHMLAVAPEARDRGLGRALKAYQREALRERGIRRMFWTFDPLVARNAHLNLRVLGAGVTAYHRNLYGESPMSRTDSVIGSDRFVVEWDLTAATDRRTGAPVEGPVVTPRTPDVPDADRILVGIPRDIQALKVARAEEAHRWREVTRAAFERALAAGYRVGGVVDTADGLAYELVRDDD